MNDTKIKQILEDWNWNASLFEMYDDIRSMRLMPSDLSRLMTKTYEYFNKESQIKDLAEHLRVDTSSWSVSDL